MKTREWKMASWSTDWDGISDPATSVQGVCRFDEEDGIFLDVPFGSISNSRHIRCDGGTCVQTYGRETPKRLVGMTQDGVRIVLENVQSLGIGCSSPGTCKETLVASTAYASRSDFDDSKAIMDAQLEVSGLFQWLDLELPVPQKDGAYTIKNERIVKCLPLFRGERVSISIQCGMEKPRRWRDSFEARCFASVKVDCAEGMSLGELWHEVVWPTQSLFAFLFGFYPAIDSMWVRFGEGCGSAAVYQESYVSKKRLLRSDAVPIRFCSLGDEGLHDIASRWFALGGDERRAAVILTTLLGGWTMPLELSLTAASTLVDALGRASEKKPYGKTEFRELVKPILEAAPEDLRNRLKVILGQLNCHPYSDRLDAVYVECGEYGKTLIEDWDGFKRVQKGLRNKGAHALDGGESVAVQIDHYHALILLSYYVLLRRLGASEEALRGFRDSRFLYGFRNQIRLRYSVSHGTGTQ